MEERKELNTEEMNEVSGGWTMWKVGSTLDTNDDLNVNCETSLKACVV